MTRPLNEWRNDQWSTTLEFLDTENQSLWSLAKRVVRVRTPSPSGHPGGIALSDYEKAEALAKSFEAQFQLVTDP